MFQPLECFIGLRYLRSGRRRGLVSFMSAASLAGIGLGVAALLVILSVMNGLEGEFRNRLLSMTEHLRVTLPAESTVALTSQIPRLEAYDDVRAVTPFTEIEGMLSTGSMLRPAIVRGVVPAAELASSRLAEIVGETTLTALAPGSRFIVLGRFLALSLGVGIGDPVDVVLASLDGGLPDIRRVRFTVAGIFDAGIENHDANLALVHLTDAGGVLGSGDDPQGLAVSLDDPMRATAVQEIVAADLGAQFRYSNWASANASLFRAMAIEKTMMTIVLMFIVGVAAFNIVASLMMVVSEKEKDIAILRTYGLDPKRVVRIFFVQGATIGVLGTLLGTLLGLLLAVNVETIVPWLESTFNFKIMPGDVFYVTEIPSEIQIGDVVLLPSLALVIAILATWWPARRAARVQPADVLRYE